MKKLILLAMLLGLTGCGDNNQSDTQTNTQANTLQKAEAAPVLANYSMAASPRAMSAVASLQGWNLLSNAPLGAETIIEAGKGQLGSIASIRPNAKQVAEVLRGGAAGIALNIAVEQLLGAVDWVLDPANNQITYKPKIDEPIQPDDPRFEWVYTCTANFLEVCKGRYYSSPRGVSNLVLTSDNPISYCWDKDSLSGCVFKDEWIFYVKGRLNSNFEPQNLSLETVAEQVISNADAGSLDAQVATNIAAQNILNDVELAKPVVQELEENAKYAGVAPRPNKISHDRENEILRMKPNDPCDEISRAIKDLDETIQWRKDDLNPAEKGQRVYVGHQKRIRILNEKKDEMNRAYKVWCEGK